MIVRRVAPDSWTAELDSFSRQHEGWLVSIKTRGPDGGVAVAARDLPLQGVSSGSRESSNIVVMVGDHERHLTHDVHDVVALGIELMADNAERALIIEAKDGSTTTIEFRSPMRAENVDGLPSPHR